MLKALPHQVVALASARHGVVTARELLAAGLSRPGITRRAQAGMLVRLRYGVLAVPGLSDPLASVVAVELLHPRVVAERTTAAYVWQLDGCKDDPAFDIVHPRTPHRPRLAGLRIADLPDGAVTTHAGIRVTRPAWTIAHLSADADLVELALESALRMGLTTESELRAFPTLSPVLSRRRPGDPPTGSYAETRFLQRIVRPLGLEDPERQVEVPGPTRGRPYRCDFVFRRARPLDVEIDGRDTHDGDHDSVRDHHVRRAGYQVARFTAWRIERRRSEVGVRLVQELAAVTAAPPLPAGPAA